MVRLARPLRLAGLDALTVPAVVMEAADAVDRTMLPAPAAVKADAIAAACVGPTAAPPPPPASGQPEVDLVWVRRKSSSSSAMLNGSLPSTNSGASARCAAAAMVAEASAVLLLCGSDADGSFASICRKTSYSTREDCRAYRVDTSPADSIAVAGKCGNR